MRKGFVYNSVVQPAEGLIVEGEADVVSKLDDVDEDASHLQHQHKAIMDHPDDEEEDDVYGDANALEEFKLWDGGAEEGETRMPKHGEQVYRPGKKRWMALLVLLCILGLVIFVYIMFVPSSLMEDEESSAPTQSPSRAVTKTPTPMPTKSPTWRYGGIDFTGWDLKKFENFAYLEQEGVCHFETVIGRVNNRPGKSINCYAACTGLNLQLKNKKDGRQCVGWTLVKRKLCTDDSPDWDCIEDDTRGFNTCILLSDFSNNGMLKDSSCSTGKLFEEDLVRPPEGVPVPKRGKKNKVKQDSNSPPKVIPMENFTATCPVRAALNITDRPLRIFITCVQSSGCTLLSYLLAQRDRTTSVLDLGVRQNIPTSTFFRDAEASYPKVDTIVIKAALRGMGAGDPLEWIERYQEMYDPDISILFTRNPLDALEHMADHIGHAFENRVPADWDLGQCHQMNWYATRPLGPEDESYGLTCGTPDSKLRALEKLYVNREAYNLHHITYEEICNNRKVLVDTLKEMGICIPLADVRQPKWSVLDTMRFSFKYFTAGKRSTGNVFWGVGNLVNTFHDDYGRRVPEETAYRMCQSDEELKRWRAAKIPELINPYRKAGLEGLRKLAKLSAPSLYTFYENYHLTAQTMSTPKPTASPTTNLRTRAPVSASSSSAPTYENNDDDDEYYYYYNTETPSSP